MRRDGVSVGPSLCAVWCEPVQKLSPRIAQNLHLYGHDHWFCVTYLSKKLDQKADLDVALIDRAEDLPLPTNRYPLILLTMSETDSSLGFTCLIDRCTKAGGVQPEVLREPRINLFALLRDVVIKKGQAIKNAEINMPHDTQHNICKMTGGFSTLFCDANVRILPNMLCSRLPSLFFKR